jgi:hypothetical protein
LQIFVLYLKCGILINIIRGKQVLEQAGDWDTGREETKY